MQEIDPHVSLENLDSSPTPIRAPKTPPRVSLCTRPSATNMVASSQELCVAWSRVLRVLLLSGLCAHSRLMDESPCVMLPSPREVVGSSKLCSILPLQASSPADESLASSHLEFKFEPEDFAFTSSTLSPQAGLSGVLRQEAWCALALA